ncbi:DNA-binding protein [Saccharomonospora sp. CUA-673]|uniref:helix-turn-helix domain-containing protein n=1 Tax=Saccharomonospora sp. CUA-673 TaxID=1904969 RepID=UPI000968DF61|nr:helix-turn-helix domain-containing protein [Saccharomonospora sp. CUA-673]OLT47822.1 DNA-binding protein [Saccharomonospora sp. CUA-673]
MADLEAEFTSEPFRGEGAPPEHAVRAREAAEHAGLTTDFGPLGTSVRGEADTVLEALPAIARAALEGGATRLTLRVQHPGHEEPDESGAGTVLEGMVRQVEAELGARLSELDRPGKQRAVRLLDERGAFQLRRSAAEVAELLGVTRFTVYNYLNRQ